jgi:hypothetical protein
MFVASPFIIGAITAYIANRKRDLGTERTMLVVLMGTAIGGAALLAVALEGVVCIGLAAPLGFGVAVIGGLLGRAIAVRLGSSPGQTMGAIALVPLIFVSESLMPTTTRFDTQQAIEINAPPAVVWQSIIRMDMRDEPVALSAGPRLSAGWRSGGRRRGRSAARRVLDRHRAGARDRVDS